MANRIKGGGNVPNKLSTDLTVITSEINTYKKIAGEAIFEIGRRLKYVRDASLDSEDPEEVQVANERERLGGWMRWLSEHVDFNHSHARKFIIVAESFTDGLFPRTSGLGILALHLIATLPEEERSKEHEVNGQTKKPKDMTVRELRELKKQLKEERERANLLDEQRRAAERDASILRDTLESIEDTEPSHSPDPNDYRSYGMRLSKEMYEAFDELSAWQKKYAWITTDIDEFKQLAKADDDFAREFARLNAFWSKVSEAFRTRERKEIVEYEIIDA